jgi:hypothetical protein
MNPFLRVLLAVVLSLIFFLGASSLTDVVWPQLADVLPFKVALGCAVGIPTGWIVGRLTS